MLFSVIFCIFLLASAHAVSMPAPYGTRYLALAATAFLIIICYYPWMLYSIYCLRVFCPSLPQ